MIGLAISGGQTGADQGALRAARAAGVATGGWAARGWLTEDGPAPWLRGWGLKECPSRGYPARTAANCRLGDATVWIGRAGTPGHRCTRSACEALGKPFLDLRLLGPPKAAAMLLQSAGLLPLAINFAGNRESHAPGIGAEAERLAGELIDWLRRLASAEK